MVVWVVTHSLVFIDEFYKWLFLVNLIETTNKSMDMTGDLTIFVEISTYLDISNVTL